MTTRTYRRLVQALFLASVCLVAGGGSSLVYIGGLGPVVAMQTGVILCLAGVVVLAFLKTERSTELEGTKVLPGNRLLVGLGLPMYLGGLGLGLASDTAPWLAAALGVTGSVYLFWAIAASMQFPAAEGERTPPKESIPCK